jgi:hypothetical protein
VSTKCFGDAEHSVDSVHVPLARWHVVRVKPTCPLTCLRRSDPDLCPGGGRHDPRTRQPLEVNGQIEPMTPQCREKSTEHRNPFDGRPEANAVERDDLI